MTLGQAYNCTSPQVLHWLLPGTWAFSVVGADPAGNTAPAQQVEWTVEYAEAAGMYTRFLRCVCVCVCDGRVDAFLEGG